MSPALRDLVEMLGLSINPMTPMLDELVQAALTEGVKIGGIYKHWKGKQYLVTDVVRDADNWETFKVVYQELTDARHRAERRVSWFLGDMNDERYSGPRFRLVG